MSITIADLQAFADASNRQDIETLMRFMTADCVFEASAGMDVCGARYVGREAVQPISINHPSTMRACCHVSRCGDPCSPLGNQQSSDRSAAT